MAWTFLSCYSRKCSGGEAVRLLEAAPVHSVAGLVQEGEEEEEDRDTVIRIVMGLGFEQSALIPRHDPASIFCMYSSAGLYLAGIYILSFFLRT